MPAPVVEGHQHWDGSESVLDGHHERDGRVSVVGGYQQWDGDGSVVDWHQQRDKCEWDIASRQELWLVVLLWVLEPQ